MVSFVQKSQDFETGNVVEMGISVKAVRLRFFNHRWTQINADGRRDEEFLEPRMNANRRELKMSYGKNHIHPQDEGSQLFKMLIFRVLFVSIGVHSRFLSSRNLLAS